MRTPAITAAVALITLCMVGPASSSSPGSTEDCAIVAAAMEAIIAHNPGGAVGSKLASVSFGQAPGSDRDPGAEVRTLNLRACPGLDLIAARGGWILFDPTAAERRRWGPKGFEHFSRLWRKGDVARLRYYIGRWDEAPGRIDLRRDAGGRWRVVGYEGPGIWIRSG